MSISAKVENFDTIEGEWERILPYCEANTIFVTPWWQRLWWRHFGGGGELNIVSVREDDEIIGIAPLMLRDNVLSFLGDTDLFDYHDLLVLPGKEIPFYNALCEFIIEMDWHTMELKSLREISSTLKYLPELAESKGYAVERTDEDVSPYVTLPSTWDEYLGSLRKKDRHELRRKIRRLESADHANQYICDSPETLNGCMDDFFRLLRASSHEKDEFLVPEREAFFKDMALDLAPRGEFRLYFMEVDGVKVASCICFDYAGTYLLYNSGYDPEYSSLSVGLLNKALSLKDAIEEGKQSFDFLRGDERYKYNLGAENQMVYQLIIRR